MYQKVVKLREGPSYHLDRGNQIHKFAEDFVNKKLPSLPPILNKFASEFENLVNLEAKAEEEFVLDRNWNRLDAWLHPDAWFRMKLDARVGNFLIDYKTGKKYDGHEDQARLYANVWMMLNPEVEEVDVEFWYIDSGEVVGWTFYRPDLDYHIREWELLADTMLNDEIFEPKVNQWCSRCYVKEFCNAYE
jgi:CRISPR/Cas system-associated exonuclease Cas4 (RecB family)